MAMPISRYQGFTLIELVIVVIILGILAAVAIPKFVTVSADAQTNATNAVAASLSSANSINFASRTENSTKGIAVANCTDLSGALQGGVPTGYTITSGAVTAGNTVTCTLTGPSSTSATFSAAGIA